MNLLALDPSTTYIGWAHFRDGALIQCAAWKLAGDSLDAKLADAGNWLSCTCTFVNAEVLAVEMPVVHKNAATTIKLAQMVGVLRYAAWHWTRRTVEVQPGERLTALGLPVRMKRKEAKAHVIRNVNQMFDLELTSKDHDAADAVAVGLAALGKLKQEEWERELS